jgi:hypothetical protein
MGSREVQPSLHHPLGGLQRGVGPAPHPAPGPAHQAPRSNQNNHRFRKTPYKFGNEPLSSTPFIPQYISSGIKVVDTILKSKRLLLLSSITVEYCVEALKCPIVICISFVYLTKQCQS